MVSSRNSAKPETLAGNNIVLLVQHHTRMMNVKDSERKISLLNHYVQSLCGLYSRVARQLNVDRSYVSRVARRERRSEPIERALSTEFDRIVDDTEP